AKTIVQSRYYDDQEYWWITPSFVWKQPSGGDTWFGVCTDPTGPWTWTSRGLDNANCIALAFGNGWLVSGWPDLGPQRSHPNGADGASANDSTWTGAWNGHGGSCYTVLADPSGNGHVWASNGRTFDTCTLRRSTDDGATWTAVTGLPRSAFLFGLELEPTT